MTKKNRRDKRDARKQRKLARYKEQVDISKTPVLIDGDLEDQNSTILWSFGIFDDFEKWKDDQPSCFCLVSNYLKEFEKRTWNEVSQDRKHNHPITLDKICKDATDRLLELNLDDQDEIWSFRFGGTIRIWGIRDRRVFRALWWDPKHMVYPIDLQDREKNSAG